MTFPDRAPGGGSLEIHRLLDEAFAGIEMTPARQDVKEEIRANLVARMAELSDQGLGPAAAARRAIDDLGDLRDLVEETEPVTGAATAAAQGRATRTGPWPQAGQRVRPRPAFVLRTVGLSAVCLAGLAVLGLSATVLDLALAARLAAVAAVALAAGGLTADALRQETTGNYPMPTVRAAGYAAALALALAGLGLAWQYVPQRAVGWPIAGAGAGLGAALLFAYLAATQTNRRKAWLLHWSAAQAGGGDRFSEDPAAAARFGIYTLVIWLVTSAAFVAVTLTLGWTWSWLAVVAGLAAMMITLARMLFGRQQ